MAKFRVSLHRCVESGLPGRNPFRVQLSNISLDVKSRYSVRTWEVYAKSEAEVRRLYEEAVEQKLPNVRGYSIRSIERIDGAVDREVHTKESK